MELNLAPKHWKVSITADLPGELDIVAPTAEAAVVKALNQVIAKLKIVADKIEAGTVEIKEENSDQV